MDAPFTRLNRFQVAKGKGEFHNERFDALSLRSFLFDFSPRKPSARTVTVTVSIGVGGAPVTDHYSRVKMSSMFSTTTAKSGLQS